MSGSTHPVKQLMADRLDQGSRPGLRQDNARLALVIEGGAMRGVVSAGMATELEQLGLTEVFDDVYGTSVGAITGAYFIAGQTAYGATTFADDLRDRRFVDFRRLLRREPVLSLRYAYDQLTRHHKPLNTAAVLASPIRLHVVAACLETGAPVDLGRGDSADALRLRFKAASCLPLLAGPPIEVEGRRYYDGGLFDSVPWRQAVDDGCTHVLALQSWPASVLRQNPSGIERFLAVQALRRAGPEFVEAYLTRAERYNADSAMLANDREALLSIAPGPEALISHLERDRDKLLRAGQAGAASVRQALSV